jgi:hypothetical protein
LKTAHHDSSFSALKWKNLTGLRSGFFMYCNGKALSTV